MASTPKSQSYMPSSEALAALKALEASENAGGTQENTSQTSTQDAGRLPAVLNMRDLIVFMVLIVVFVSNTAGVQIGGPAAFLYWILGLLTFLIPCAYVTRWLALRFPGQGAPYIWAARILGGNWSFFCAFCAWLPGVLAVVSVIESGLTFIQYLAPAWFTTPVQQCVAIVFVLLVSTGITCLPLHRLKHILLVMTALYLCVFVLLGAAGAWWLWSGHAPAIALNSPRSWQLNSGNFAIYGLVVLAFLGVDIPIFMGSEIRGGKTGVKRASLYVWWGAALSFVVYVIGTFGIMVIVPPSQSGAMVANVQAIQIVFGSLAGNVVAVVLALSQIALTIAYILMFSRLLVVVAQDRRLPVSLTKTNGHGVPVLSIGVQAAVVAIVAMLSLVIVPSFFGTLIRPDDLANAIYNVLQAGTTVLWVCTIIQLFLLVFWLLFQRKNRVEVPTKERVLLLSMSFIGTGASCVGIWATISSSWLPSLIPNDRWVLLVLGVTLISLVAGLLTTELPRMYAQLGEQRRLNDREIVLREQLQEAYDQMDLMYQEQAEAAVTDAITGLPNHRAIMSRIEEEVSRSQRSQCTCAVLFVDLDHFKQVNDSWGHRAGDAILHEVGSRLRTALRIQDFVGRYGGEEFAIVLTDIDLDGARQAAERLRAAVASQPCSWQAEDTSPAVPIVITASIGVAAYPLHGVNREALIEAADRAMYQAKHTGRNRVCLADVEMEYASSENMLTTAIGELTEEGIAIQALTAAASAHDWGTNTHAQRLVRRAEATARVLGRPEEEIRLIRMGALLHDIGKIGVPEAILHKPGPLTEEEWTIMRRHPEIGRQILEHIGGVFQSLSYIVAAHHERWDGRGYPMGLAENSIPISARILSVVDSYDAMTSRRPYRDPMTGTQARAELLRCAGSQYDPQVVEAFFRVLDEEDGGSHVNGDAELVDIARK